MPVHVTVTLDSGTFLPKNNEKDTYYEIGYFECDPAAPDIRIFIDGEEPDDIPSPFKLCDARQKCDIAVRHKDKDDRTKTDGVKISKTFHSQLLCFKRLYGDHQYVERTNFDCVIRFDSGHFRSSMVKKRDFKEHKRKLDGSYSHDPKYDLKTVEIAHNMVVYFTLADGEALELARDGKPFWTSKGKTIRERLEIEIAADNSTAEKFFRSALKDDSRESYFLPNQGDPPPSCPMPPCPE